MQIMTETVPSSLRKYMLMFLLVKENYLPTVVELCVSFKKKMKVCLRDRNCVKKIKYIACVPFFSLNDMYTYQLQD